MVIGVAAVMTMVALGSGARASVEDEMKSAGTNLVYVSAGNYTRGGDDIKVASGLGAAKTLVSSDVDAIRSQIGGIKFISLGVGDRAPMSAGERRYFNRVVGVGADFAAMYSWTIRRGTMFAASDVARRARVAVVGAAAATALFGSADPVGQSFAVRNETFRVAGVTDSKIEDQGDSIFFPSPPCSRCGARRVWRR
jgi:putative ABC transport system permease protein